MSARGFRNWEEEVRTVLYPDTTVHVHYYAARLNLLGGGVVRSAIGGGEGECDVHDLRVVRHEVVRGNLLGVRVWVCCV
jgi:hypothetical protein